MLIWGIIAILLSVGLFLIISQTDVKAIAQAYKKQIKEKRTNRSTFFNIPTGKFIRDLEKRIEKSNIRFYISYNPWIHMLLCIIFFLSAVTWMYQHMNIWIAATFGLLAAILPYILLQLFSDMMSYRVKRMSVDFLIIMSRFLAGGKGGDVFLAFKKASKYVLQPLKTFVEIFVYEYEHKVNPIQCFENLKDRIENQELKLYIENLKICYIRGGDTIELTNTFIEEIDRQNDDDDEENIKDLILTSGLYVLLGVNFLILYILFNSSYKRAIFDSSWGQIVFGLDLFISFYIAYLTLEKID